MSLYKGNNLIGGMGKLTVRNAHTLLDFKWSDHIINSMEWLRSDTFSWQPGSVYQAVYNHLVADITGKTAQKDTYGDIEIWYYLSDDGHKIAGLNQEQAISRVYDNTGTAWYYILDEENERFKLPRMSHKGFVRKDENNSFLIPNYSREVQIAAAGSTFNYTAPEDGIIIGNLDGSAANSITVNGYIGVVGGNDASNEGPFYMVVRKGDLCISTTTTRGAYFVPYYSNETYTESMHLYFYVGQFSQSATEQTAGLNADLLNAKADVDMFKVVTSLPTNPDPNVWYAILEE